MVNVPPKLDGESDEEYLHRLRRSEDLDASHDGLTRQEFKDDCDLNKIVARYEKTGMVDALERQGFYGDVSELLGYKDALNVVIQARELFNSLDASVRERFYNDPARLIDFLDDPKNRDEAVRLGLVNPPPVVPAAQVAK